MGHLIPAGTGVSRYRWIRVEDDLAEEEDIEPIFTLPGEEGAEGATTPTPPAVEGDFSGKPRSKQQQ